MKAIAQPSIILVTESQSRLRSLCEQGKNIRGVTPPRALNDVDAKGCMTLEIRNDPI